MSKFSRKPTPRFDPRAALDEAMDHLRFDARHAPRSRPKRRVRRVTRTPLEPTRDPRLAPEAILNHEGGLAFGRDERTTLVNMAACSLVDERAFYGDTTEKVRLFLHRVARKHPEWTVKLAVFLRERLHLRSISQLVIAHAAMVEAARPLVERALSRVAVRPDDLLEIVSLLKDDRHGLAHGLPAVIRRAVSRELNGLREYHLIKYRKAGSFGLKHLVQLCHPRPRSPREAFLFRYLVNPKAWRATSEEDRASYPVLEAWEAIRRGHPGDRALLERCARIGLPWEVVVPHFGSRPEVWARLVPRLPIMALVRNLRNLHEQGCLRDPEIRKAVRNRLTDPEVVRKSRQLPFRWLSAYRVMEGLDREVAAWLEVALQHSLANLPVLPGLTVIACDNSLSMSFGGISRNSKVRPVDIASLFGAMAREICAESILFVFGTEIALVKFPGSGSVLDRALRIARVPVGQATHVYKVPGILSHLRLPVDRILVFTDMQVYGEDSSWCEEEEFTTLLRRYREQVAPHLRTYIFNLQPYEHFMTPADEHGVTCFSGWSEGLLRYVALDSNEKRVSMVDLVDEVEL